MLDKSFTPAEAETALYQAWEGNDGAFAAQPGSNAAPFTIMIPPPNVTGSLHVGHALTNTIQDVLIRWRRMQGRDALWQPGHRPRRHCHADGGGAPTGCRRADAQGNRPRRLPGAGVGVEGAIRRHHHAAVAPAGLLAGLGRASASPWMPGCRRRCARCSSRCIGRGLIYRDRRLVNWDPKFQSAISDLEVESREVKGSLWHIRYPVREE